MSFKNHIVNIADLIWQQNNFPGSFTEVSDEE